MIASFLTALNLLLVAAEVALTPDGGASPAPLLALALAAAVVLTVAVAVLVFRLLADAPPARPTRPIDPSAPLAQSDPDAAGHPRPRAPGRAAPAA
ncbi:DUF6412 domain-containing protein [Microbacterium sp. NPDC016588]|jgi:hypothetical protein|uniref:DUF6412 domain-containing protein n=1 Tax=unclassified Microbacterium TaxID=2609290 RepID=UPI00097BB493|nr:MULTISPECIES: DUF6412 domain-containing protein [unclassified Microbacterium]MDI9892968.1 DUF6412 domain-containing protein [Microbacterium sp. IEGM 1404]MXS73135.1 hypothetical protein [Microbacterium sp. TL13]ONI66062.1 hypothetical protein CSIV_02890 [Microbacterium sp. CSI-V]